MHAPVHIILLNKVNALVEQTFSDKPNIKGVYIKRRENVSQRRAGAWAVAVKLCQGKGAMKR